ncbi:type II and III secretion system protein family protein [Ovoidimarina sediminis]|uniref:type II and III secretion system protein family protein n=1 Tax=Ovoidimarina sediminis TaxID=3079856 RepID=UPI002915B795|nr:type II and III secretion system protein family protein [Rhodophyticola sp. MJ-SS7]MDU8942951.1 type II and III secretion system protein family protein [Rhodophyticola sp. MJ-SS7]
MNIDRFLKAALLGFAIVTTSVPVAEAQTLRVLRGEASSTLNVAINRAVVVEAEEPFAELSIANPGIADISTLSDRTIYVLGRAPGRTTLTLLGPEGNLIANVEVAVAPDVAEFKERLRQILPGEGIEVRTANDGIVLSGVVSSIVKLDRALDLAERYAPGRVSNLMVVGGTQQVQLKVRFVEMQRSVSKGLNGALTGGDVGTESAGDFALGNSNIVPGTAIGSPGGTEFQLATPANSGGQLNIAFQIGGMQLGILLEALEAKRLVRTLSEPNLVALSGQQATFLAGGEYPIPVSDGDGGTQIEFRPFGVQLTFIPRVTDGDNINLQLTAAVSSIDPTITVGSGVTTVNAFRKRETQTTVEMRDGQSFAIAGLLEDDFQDAVSQTPWLGDIPVLGALFRSAEYQREQSELVVIITPHLVSPTRGEALALPTDRVRLPTESELFLMGSTVGGISPHSGAAAEVAKQDFSGSFGYVME